MKRTAVILGLLVLLALAAFPVQAKPAPASCGGPVIGIESWPFLCSHCSVCANFLGLDQYTVCYWGYFDGCGDPYPPCRQWHHIRLFTMCDCP